MGENHQFKCASARHFARLSIINFRIDVNLLLRLGADLMASHRQLPALARLCPVGQGHSRLDNAGVAVDYADSDERPVF